MQMYQYVFTYVGMCAQLINISPIGKLYQRYKISKNIWQLIVFMPAKAHIHAYIYIFIHTDTCTHLYLYFVLVVRKFITTVLS